MRTKQPRTKQPKFTIHQFNKTFPDDAACLDVLRDLIYPDGINCRTCKEVRPHHRLTHRKAYSCDYCGTHVYVLAGTIFAKSTTPLKSWFYAMHLIASTRCGISAKQLERELGVTYKTAWRMFNQIRKLMADSPDTMLWGDVEVDETWIGGKERRVRSAPHGMSLPNKTIVVGGVERGGRVKAQVVPDATMRSIMPFIKTKVLPESMIYTDDAKAFNNVEKSGFRHRRVNHSAKIYVVGDAYTNTIEGFWSLLKNGIRGVYHSVSRKHLQSYVDEYSFRYNHRHAPAPMYTLVESEVRHTRYGRYGRYAPIG